MFSIFIPQVTIYDILNLYFFSFAVYMNKTSDHENRLTFYLNRHYN